MIWLHVVVSHSNGPDHHNFSTASRRSLSPSTSTQGPECIVRALSHSLPSIKSSTELSSAPGWCPLSFSALDAYARHTCSQMPSRA